MDNDESSKVIFFCKIENRKLISFEDIDRWADPTAPKALADVFEALVGAIFLDSGYSLEAVWKIIEPLLRTYISMIIYSPHLKSRIIFFQLFFKTTQH